MIRKYALLINFIVPAMLLNSVGVVILMLHTQAGENLGNVGWLQPFKDGSIIVASIVLISFISRFGYKVAIQCGCILEIIACLLMAISPSKWVAYGFFVMVGVGFALLKISIYSSLSFVTTNKDEHASLLSLYEGAFMLSIFIGNGLFSWMIYLKHWHATFYIFALFAAIAFISAFSLNFSYSKHTENEIVREYGHVFKLLLKPVILLFLMLTILYPFIEQGFIDFLPTFQSTVLNLSHSKSVLIAAILPVMIATGRILFGFVLKYIHVGLALFLSILLAILLLIISLISANYARDYFYLEYIAIWSLPVLGLFIAPIYPTLNSSVLSSQPKDYQSAVALLIMIFSAIGGSVGSVLMGYLFHYVGGIKAFSLYIFSLFIIGIIMIPYFKLLKK